ncbi:hypothetical protein D4764_12G0005140 [Takifugu flavidus]|uniref:Uncharacterized protein n=1 Tax=Takifugu flavidus TaxID=433684 RepID=A0A5C6PBG6_9TELE|nr:hypothetical protein D4764_12G0005140 [Takifugu flavidus]
MKRGRERKPEGKGSRRGSERGVPRRKHEVFTLQSPCSSQMSPCRDTMDTMPYCQCGVVWSDQSRQNYKVIRALSAKNRADRDFRTHVGGKENRAFTDHFRR